MGFFFVYVYFVMVSHLCSYCVVIDFRLAIFDLFFGGGGLGSSYYGAINLFIFQYGFF